jgi:tetratricopeptide (TPR) repeat protein
LLYLDQGRYAEAEPLYLRALALTEAALGNDHATTGTSLNNLALLYQDQGRYAEAEPLLERAMKIFEAALGPDHPSTRTVKANYGLLLTEKTERERGGH